MTLFARSQSPLLAQSRLASRLALAGIVLVAAAVAARAQSSIDMNGNAAPTPHVIAPTVKHDQAPAALPGAESRPDSAAPADRIANDMQPTDALFDAIDRGDIAAARDAVSRGADLSGRNLLGLTPLDESIDLGRKDITFLLLSLRGADAGPGGPVQQAQKAPPPDKPARAPAAVASRAGREHAPARERAAANPPALRPATARTAKLFAGDTGTPVPQAGFLGFGGAAQLR